MAVLKYKKSDGTYASLVNYAIKNIDIVQSSGTSSGVVMSQSAVTRELNAVTNALDGKVSSGDVAASIESAINEIEIPSVENYFDGAVYDSDNHRINFKHGDDVKAYIDASPFLVDGMVDNVEISEGKLVITFNTDAGKQNIEIPISNIFDANNYYDKAAIDTALAAKANTADTYTKTEVNNLLNTKSNTGHTHEISGVTNLQTALNGKQASGNYVSSTTLSNYSTTTQMNSAIDAATSGKVETSTYKTYTATTDAALAAKANTADTYTKTEVNNLLNTKSNTGHTHEISGVTNLQTALNGKQASGNYVSSTTLSNYSTTTQMNSAIDAATSGKVETSTYKTYTATTDTALSGKALNSDLTGHTSDTTAHITSNERTNWNSAYTKAPIYLAETVSSNKNSLTFPTEYINSGDTSYNGKQVIVIYHNSSNSEITLSFPSPSASFITDDNTAKTVKVKGGGYGEVSYLNINGTIFMRCV